NFASPTTNAAFDIKQTDGGGTGLSLSGSTKPTPGFSLGGSLDANIGGTGGDSVTGKLNEAYGSTGFAEKLSLGGTSSDQGEPFNATGSSEAQILPNLYAGAFGSFNSERGKENDYFAGGSLTYMASPSIGITAAGGYGTGGAEGRLQADFYNGSVHGA